ncbi:MAG: methylmalonyl Co-A mutase-associated GTPase MeaB [Nitrospira sp.]
MVCRTNDIALARFYDVTKHDQTHIEAVAELIRAGQVRAVSRLITRLENGEPDGSAVLRLLGKDVSGARVIGITGYPGAGKSTLIDGLIGGYRRVGKKVGVLAVDISSPVTGGAVLGDRVRMQDHAGDPMVYIRSMASRGQGGGLARTTHDAAKVLKAAGYDVILIETIGVGQSEIDIANVAQVVVAVVAPGLGDEVQAMKAGLLEVADIVVVNKSDLPGADAALKNLRAWCRAVLPVASVNGTGIPQLMAAIAEQRTSKVSNSQSVDSKTVPSR